MHHFEALVYLGYPTQYGRFTHSIRATNIDVHIGIIPAEDYNWSMDLKKLAVAIVKQYGAVVDQIKGEVWQNATPCSEWTLHDLVNHVTGEVLWIPAMLQGQTIAEVGTKYDGDVLGDDPAKSWHTAESAAESAIKDLTDLKATVHLSYGDFPAKTYLIHMIIDGGIHAWDTLMGAGLDYQLDDKLVGDVYKLFLEEAPSWRGAGILGEEVKVPADSDTLTKLLGLSGRDISWAPTNH